MDAPKEELLFSDEEDDSTELLQPPPAATTPRSETSSTSSAATVHGESEAALHPFNHQNGAPLFEREDKLSSRLQAVALEDDELYEDGNLTNAKTASSKEWACSYCGLDDNAAVAQCYTCRKWFCNGSGSHRTSHLITHLVRSKHKEVRLHKGNQLGDTILECYNCGSRNVFLLGFVPAKAESVVVILCRHPCASHASQKDGDWADSSHWEPLIKDRAFLSWILQHPTEADMSRHKNLSLEVMYALEDLWKSDGGATVDDIGKAEVDKNLPPVQLRYNNAYQYRDTFSALINAEAECDRKMKEQQHHENVNVDWKIITDSNSSRWQAGFSLPNVDWEVKLMPGDELRVCHNERRFSADGIVTKVPDSNNEKIFILFRAKEANVPSTTATGFRVEYVWKATSYDRMKAALRNFATDNMCVHQFIFNSILGNNGPSYARSETRMLDHIPRNVNAPKLPKLNSSQQEAVRFALQKQIALIQGPPGTGKTVTSATIIYQLVKLHKTQVLVCAPSNIAVDQLAEKLHVAGLKVLRIYAKSRENVESSVLFLSMHQQTMIDEELKALQAKRDDSESAFSAKDDVKYAQLRTNVETRLLKNADVVCTTCIGASDPRLRGKQFRFVLVDESTQAIEPECLVPIVKGSKQIILVGDHCQLGPVVMDKDVANAGLASSLFERLVVLGNRPQRLEVQYRMHPCLSVFSSNYFYEGSLQNGITEADRKMKNTDFPWPAPDKPMVIINVPGCEEMSSNGTSFLNRAEAKMVEKIVSNFIKSGLNPEQIGVITPYEGQRSYIVQYLHASSSLSQTIISAIEVASVDAFQGREKDIIIMTCVRSNETQGIGFLRDPRRLNVAITRAKYGLIIVGNAKCLSQSQLWNLLLHHYREHGALVEGPLGALHAYSLMLPLPKKVSAAAKPRGKFLLDGAIIQAESGMAPPELPGGQSAGQTYAGYSSGYNGGMMPPYSGPANSNMSPNSGPMMAGLSPYWTGMAGVVGMGGMPNAMSGQPPAYFRDPTQAIAPETCRVPPHLYPFVMAHYGNNQRMQHQQQLFQQQQAAGGAAAGHSLQQQQQRMQQYAGGFNPFFSNASLSRMMPHGPGSSASSVTSSQRNNPPAAGYRSNQNNAAAGYGGLPSTMPGYSHAMQMAYGQAGAGNLIMNQQQRMRFPAMSQVSQSEYKSMSRGGAFDASTTTYDEQMSQSGYAPSTHKDNDDTMSSVGSEYSSSRVSTWGQHPSMRK